MGNHQDLLKAISWILAGNPIVYVHKKYVARIEKVLKIRLKKLTTGKYLVVNSKGYFDL